MRQSQDENVQKLYKAQESNAKLVEDLAKATDASSAAKAALSNQKARWETEKADFLAEIDSLKVRHRGEPMSHPFHMLQHGQSDTNIVYI